MEGPGCAGGRGAMCGPSLRIPPRHALPRVGGARCCLAASQVGCPRRRRRPLIRAVASWGSGLSCPRMTALERGTRGLLVSVGSRLRPAPEDPPSSATSSVRRGDGKATARRPRQGDHGTVSCGGGVMRRQCHAETVSCGDGVMQRRCHAETVKDGVERHGRKRSHGRDRRSHACDRLLHYRYRALTAQTVAHIIVRA